MTISDRELENLVSTQLSAFYNARLERLNKLRLWDVLSKKNPYLFKAIGTEKAQDIVEHILRARLSSSDETIFGSTFIEPLAREIAKAARSGNLDPSQGVDLGIETQTMYSAYSIKSGINWGNSSQHKQLKSDFERMRKNLYKIQKQFDSVVGHGYGNKNTEFSDKVGWRDVSGQAFWTEISGDTDLYLKLIRLMKDAPQKHKTEFMKGWDAIVNRFTKEFLEDFCNADGTIDWEKLIRFVGEKDKATRKVLAKLHRSRSRKHK